MKSILTLKKPIYVGFTVLELSKWLMYEFHYNFIKKHFDAELLFTDTDSLTYELKSKDFYDVNKKVIGKMKDESEGKIIGEFVGLKSKMYSMKNIDGKESNTAKGVNTAT